MDPLAAEISRPITDANKTYSALSAIKSGLRALSIAGRVGLVVIDEMDPEVVRELCPNAIAAGGHLGRHLEGTLPEAATVQLHSRAYLNVAPRPMSNAEAHAEARRRWPTGFVAMADLQYRVGDESGAKGRGASWEEAFAAADAGERAVASSFDSLTGIERKAEERR